MSTSGISCDELPMSTLCPETRDKLKTVATPTLMTALYKRGLRNQWIQDVHLINPAASPMVGIAFTLRYMPAREDLNPVEVFRDRNHPQRVAVEQCPPGAVLVIDSRKDPRAASAGSILISRLMVRRCAGVVTDGGFRDTPELRKLPFPCYHNRPAAPQPHPAPGHRDQRTDRLRGRSGLPRRCDCRRRRGSCGYSGASCRRNRGRDGRDDGLRGLRHRAGAKRPFHPRPLSGNRRAIVEGFCGLAQSEQAMKAHLG